MGCMANNKQLVFVDDSGDPGFKSGSSSHFVMACAIFMEDKVAEKVAEEIRNLRKSKGWGGKAEFKFNTTRKAVIKELLDIVVKYDFTVRAVYIDKAEFANIMPIIDQSKLYNWTIKELLDKAPLRDARVRIDGRSSKAYMRAASTYLRKELNKHTHKVNTIRFEDSISSDLMQLADVVAGSINRSLQKNKTDAKDYIKIFKAKIEDIEKIDLKKRK
jgi:hypothetical protein